MCIKCDLSCTYVWWAAPGLLLCKLWSPMESGSVAGQLKWGITELYVSLKLYFLLEMYAGPFHLHSSAIRKGLFLEGVQGLGLCLGHPLTWQIALSTLVSGAWGLRPWRSKPRAELWILTTPPPPKLALVYHHHLIPQRFFPVFIRSSPSTQLPLGEITTLFTLIFDWFWSYETKLRHY